MTLYYEKIETTYAALHCFADNEKLVGIFFDQNLDEAKSLGYVPGAESSESSQPLEMLKQQLDEYFGGQRKSFDIPLKITGSELQLAAWNRISQIPFGATLSYADQARSIGRPAAVRAVASANGRNRFPLIIPCHRVLRADGKIGGYSGGIELKTKLLELEKAEK